MSRIACVAVVKNEERHIAEWIGYQFACKFDAVILFDNLSTDGTKEQAAVFTKRFDVRILDWQSSTRDYQLRAYEHAVREFGAEFHWMAFLDTDEFLVLNEGVDLHAVLDARQDASAIAIPWAIFGSSGHYQRPKGLVIENFLHRSQVSFAPNKHVKSIVRPQKVQSCINPHAFEVDGVYQTLDGKPVCWTQIGVLQESPDYAVGKVHHYFTRSWEDWLLKMQRGYNDVTRRFTDFQDYDKNELFDSSAKQLLTVTKLLLSDISHNSQPSEIFEDENFHMMNKMKVAVCLVVKNEDLYILEWMIYYFALGVDTLIIYDNMSNDNTKNIISTLEKFDIRYQLWPRSDRLYQVSAYEDAITRYGHEFDWIGFFDVDEFLVDQEGRDIKKILLDYEFSGALAINWRVFGSNFHKHVNPNSVIPNFLLRSKNDFFLNRHVKMFVRPSLARTCVNPHFFVVDGTYSNENGISPEWESEGIIRPEPEFSRLQVNHYYTKSLEDWKRKFVRGYHDVPSETTSCIKENFELYDRNDVYDDSILLYDQRIRDIRRYLGLPDVNIFAPKENVEGINLASDPKELKVMHNRANIVRKLWRGLDPFNGFPKNLFEHDIQGWGSAHTYLVESIEALNPSVIVEIGVWKGASTLAMASKLRELQIDGVVIAVDTWLGAWDHWTNDEWFNHLGFDHGYPSMSRKFMNNVVAAGLEEYVVPLPLDSLNALQVLKHFDIRPNMIHIDGAHDYEAVSADLRAWWPQLETGGLLVGDDFYPEIHWPGVKKAFQTFFSRDDTNLLENIHGKCRIFKT